MLNSFVRDYNSKIILDDESKAQRLDFLNEMKL
mgnify:CR=1 FL=1